MPDSRLPTLGKFQELHDWNEAALIYKHGTIPQQSLKVYRYLGEMAEAVQKYKMLDCSAAAGRYVAALFTLCVMADVEISEFDMHLTMAAPSEWGDQSSARVMHLLTLNTARTIGDLEMAASAAGTRIGRSMAGTQLSKTIGLLKTLAGKQSFHIDRTVHNAINAILVKKGQMDVLGIFVPGE